MERQAKKTKQQKKNDIENEFDVILKKMVGIEKEVEKINDFANDTLIKASMSHCLVVVREIDKDKVDMLNQILK